MLPCYEGFFSNLTFAIIARILCGNHLNILHPKFETCFEVGFALFECLKTDLQHIERAVHVFRRSIFNLLLV